VEAVEPRARLALRTTLVRDPFEVDPGAEVVRAVRAGAAAVTGAEPELYGDTPWMDAAFSAAAGIPTVVFGPGGGAHAVEEWADLDSVDCCAEVLVAVARDVCG